MVDSDKLVYIMTPMDFGITDLIYSHNSNLA